VEVPGVPQNIEITVFEIALLPNGATDSHFFGLKGLLEPQKVENPCFIGYNKLCLDEFVFVTRN
jgi:hypothetical protein